MMSSRMNAEKAWISRAPLVSLVTLVTLVPLVTLSFTE